MNFSKINFPPSKSPRKLKFTGYLATLSKEEKPTEGQYKPFTSSELLEYPKLINILLIVSTYSPPLVADILKWIKYKYTSSRGFELGTFNPSILPTLFQELLIK